MARDQSAQGEASRLLAPSMAHSIRIPSNRMSVHALIVTGEMSLQTTSTFVGIGDSGSVLEMQKQPILEFWITRRKTSIIRLPQPSMEIGQSRRALTIVALGISHPDYEIAAHPFEPNEVLGFRFGAFHRDDEEPPNPTHASLQVALADILIVTDILELAKRDQVTRGLSAPAPEP